MKDEWNDNSEKYLDHLLTGLLFRFAREHVNAGRQDNEDISWKIAYQTLTDTLLQLKREGQFSSEVFGKLFWGLALIMVIESAYGKNVDFKLINELADRLNFSVHEYFQQAEKTENPEEPVTNELRRLQAFLTDLRCVFLQEFGYYDGIYSKTKKDYKTVLESYLLQSLSLTDNYNASYFNDLAVICWVLEKGD